MKYKVGDRVRVKSLEWYNEYKTKLGFKNDCGVHFTPDMTKFCGCIMTIKKVGYGVYYTEENIFLWTDDMFEEKIKNNIFKNFNIMDNNKMIPAKEFLIYLLENFDSISKEDIKEALKQIQEKDLEPIKKFENKIILLQEYENLIKIYKFESFDNELGEITYDVISFRIHNTNFYCEYHKNRFVTDVNEFNFNPIDYKELTEEEYKEYIKFFDETKEKLNKIIFKK